MEAAELANSRLALAAAILRVIALVLVAATIGLSVEGWLYGAEAEWPHHGLFGALAALVLLVEMLLRLAAFATGGAPPSLGVAPRVAYGLLVVLALLAAGAGYVTVAVSGPEPLLLGVAIPPLEPDISVTDALSRYLGVSFALGDYGDAPLGGVAVAAHRLLGIGVAASLLLYLGALAAQAMRPAYAGLALPAVAGQASPEAQAFGGRLRFGGWLIVWTQLFITVASGLMFQLAQPGRASAEKLPWYSEPIGWGLFALTTMGVSLALAFLYTRLSKSIIAHPERHLDPRRLFALWFLSLGILVGFFGVLTAFVAVTMSVWTLIGKIVSQPPGIAITDPTNFIRMLDMLILIANIGLLMGHVLGVGVTQWLRIHASKARLDMIHALVAARDEAQKPETAPEAPKLGAPGQA